MRWWLIVLWVMVGLGAGAAGAEGAESAGEFAFRDSLSQAASFGANWDAGFGYEVRDGALRQSMAGRQFAVVSKSPWGKRVSVEAVVTARKPVSQEWKTAGVAILHDRANYWHVTLCESPDKDGRKRLVDFQEMREDRWLAQWEDKLPLAQVEALPAFTWEYDHPYRLRLVMDEGSVIASVLEVDGKLRWRMGFVLKGPAVTDGRPALTSAGFEAEFRDFATTVAQTVPAPTARQYPAYAAVGGKGAGYFRTRQVGDRWWIVDPAGAEMFYLCTDHVNYNAHFCEALGYAPYHRNVEAKYGSEEAWAKAEVARLKEWGFTGLGAGASESVRYRGLPHTEFVNFGGDFCSLGDEYRITFPANGVPVPCSYFPNVFHPRFEAFCQQLAAERCAPRASDPWMMGYFLDNELAWWGTTWGQRTGLWDQCIGKPATHPAKQGLVQWLKGRYGTSAALAVAWGAMVATWDEVLGASELAGTQAEQIAKDKEAFVEHVADRYFAVTTRALRQADPNHLVLGCRFAGVDNPAYELAYAAAGKYCDVVTVNIYEKVDLQTGEVYMVTPAGRVPLARVLDEMNRRCGGKPMMVTEWSYPAYDSGLPNKGGAGQRVDTQQQRAFCFEQFQKLILSRPYMVGSSFFMWADEPALGISKAFPEDSNYGLVNEKDEPYALLTQTAGRTHALAAALHSGRTAEVSVSAAGEAGEFAVENTGKVAGEFVLRMRVDGKITERQMTVEPGRAQRIAVGDEPALRQPGGHLVQIEVTPEAGTVELRTNDNRADRIVVTPGVAAVARMKGWRFPLVFANPTEEVVAARVMTLRIAQLPKGVEWEKANVVVNAADGTVVPSQVDALPEGAELAMAIPAIAPHSAVTLVVGEGQTAIREPPVAYRVADQKVEVGNGRLKLMRTSGEMIFDQIELDGVEIGRFTGLLQQGIPQSIWVRPQKTRITGMWNGPVRLVMDLALEGESGTTYRMGWRVVVLPDEPWFASRAMWVENASTKAWKAIAYLHYPLSRIGGSDADDEASGSAWVDRQMQLSYGIVDPEHAMQMTFWKDEAGAEHPDAVHPVDVELGAAKRHVLPEATAYVVVGRGDRTKAWRELSDRIGAESRILVKAGAIKGR